MEVTVLYFAGASTATNLNSEIVRIPTDRPFLLSELGDLLVSLHPDNGLDKVLESSQWSVDAEMVDNPGNVVLSGGEEIAIICPVTQAISNTSLMCRLKDVIPVHSAQGPTALPNSSAFIASRLTPTTFLVKEYDDIYSEQPYIYVKLIQQLNTIIVVDTGCGGTSSNPNIEIKRLREFLETVRIEDNDGRPLNEGRRMKYLVILSHCHYDHICEIPPFRQVCCLIRMHSVAVEQFSDSVILASGYSPEFLRPSKLPEHSLCQELGIETPSYSPNLVDHMHRVLSSDGKQTSMTIMHSPGHTPDELAVYDEDERMLYVGDTLYENAPIIFPKEGSIIDWMETVDELISFVGDKESQSGLAVKINAGHETAGQPALQVLTSAKGFMEDVLRGSEKVQRRWTKRGEETVMYEQDGKRFALICPERLIAEARK
ncbi:hypothetical protein EYR36_008646 [Pleurotus pulmonarius]|nr:hypothetical protein EYR36_008646 [Pleurotus pulmonarius]